MLANGLWAVLINKNIKILTLFRMAAGETGDTKEDVRHLAQEVLEQTICLQFVNLGGLRGEGGDCIDEGSEVKHCHIIGHKADHIVSCRCGENVPSKCPYFGAAHWLCASLHAHYCVQPCNCRREWACCCKTSCHCYAL